jgi:two-component system chemotaxis response regulator CheB
VEKIKVLIVDDSAFARKVLKQMLATDPDIKVVGTAMDGIFALDKIRKLKPDVITLDINMPRMDGVEALQRIIKDFGLQVIIVSSHTKKNADLSISALEMGAFDLVAKPERALSMDLADIRKELIIKVKEASASPLITYGIEEVMFTPVKKQISPAARDRVTAERILAISASTGGPRALTYLLSGIPENYPAGILIVQHMPPDFTGKFASRLNAVCQIEVKEARDGDLILPGRVLIASCRKHLTITSRPLGMITVLSDAPPVNGHKPSADVLYRSVAMEYGEKAISLIMTGMGLDGADGMGEIMRQGGVTVAQDEGSCVVFGMPKAAIEKGNVKHVLPLEGIREMVVEHLMEEEVKHGSVSC